MFHLQLQQYRQKKDGKGSKSSGKAGKSVGDGAADAASAATKPAEVKKIHVPDLERSDSSKGLAELLILRSREKLEASDVDVVTSDLSSVSALPEADLAEATSMTTSELPLEDSAIGEAGSSSTASNEHDVDSSASNNDGPTHAIDTGMERQSSLETLEPVPVVLSAPPDLGNPSTGVATAVEVDVVHVEDQVPDVGCARILLFLNFLTLPSPTKNILLANKLVLLENDA